MPARGAAPGLAGGKFGSWTKRRRHLSRDVLVDDELVVGDRPVTGPQSAGRAEIGNAGSVEIPATVKGTRISLRRSLIAEMFHPIAAKIRALSGIVGLEALR